MTEISSSSIALAYSTRAETEFKHLSQMYSGFTGRTPQPRSEELQQKSILLKAREIDDLYGAGDDQDKRIGIEREYLYKSCTQEFVAGIAQIPFMLQFLGKEKLSRLARKTMQGAVDQIHTDDLLARFIDIDFRRIEAAEVIADEEDITPEVVFQNGDLFEEDVRRAFSATEFVDSCLPWRETILSETWVEAQQNFFNDLVRVYPFLRTHSIGMGRQKVDLTQVTRNAIDALRLPLDTRVDATSRVILTQLKRFWGPEAVEGLSPEHRQILVAGSLI